VQLNLAETVLKEKVTLASDCFFTIVWASGAKKESGERTGHATGKLL